MLADLVPVFSDRLDLRDGKLETIIRKLRRDTVRYILFICYEGSIKDGSVRRQYNDRTFYLGGRCGNDKLIAMDGK